MRVKFHIKLLAMHQLVTAILLSLAMLAIATGCANAAKKTSEPTVPDPILTATWIGTIECKEHALPFTLVIGPFAQYEAKGTFKYVTASGKDINKKVIIRRKSLDKARYFSFSTVKYKNGPGNGHVYADEGGADAGGRTFRLNRLGNLPGCRRMTAEYQSAEPRIALADKVQQNLFLPAGEWNGTAKCSRRQRHFKLTINEPDGGGLQKATIKGAGFTLPFSLQPRSGSNSGTAEYAIVDADKRIGRQASRKGTPYAIELEVPVSVQCTNMTFGLYKAVPAAGGAYASAATDRDRPFCESFGYWIAQQTSLRNQAAKDIVDMFGSNLGGNIPYSVTYEVLFKGANRDLVYGKLPIEREQELLRQIDQQLASCVLYTGRNAEDALRIYTKQAFGGRNGRQIWNSVRSAEHDSQDAMLSTFSTLYLQGRDSTVSSPITLPTEWNNAIDDSSAIRRLAKNSTDWAASHDLLAIQQVLAPYRETLRVARVTNDQKQQQAYNKQRRVEQPLELALQQYTLKDCSRLGVFLKSEGTAFAENVERNGAYCQSTTLGTTVTVGLSSATNFQCQALNSTIKTCTFNAQMGCAMASVFGDANNNRRLSQIICAPLTALTQRGLATFSLNPDKSWSATDVAIQ